MFIRNLLLVVGALCLLGGIALSIVWYSQITTPPTQGSAPVLPALLTAKHEIPLGTLLRPDDLEWKEVTPGQIRAGGLVRGQVSESEFVGAIARRQFAAGETLAAADLIKPSERQFLSAVLKPGNRAVSIPVDAPQSNAGLVLPGDQVDVILTQTFGDQDIARKSVAETVLRDVRIIAVDQTLSTTEKAPVAAARGGAFIPEAARIPKTVTFEVNDRQAEQLFVASQLGQLHIAVRPLERQAVAKAESTPPTWGSDISPALSEFARRQGTTSPVESTVRRPPVEVR